MLQQATTNVLETNKKNLSNAIKYLKMNGKYQTEKENY